MINNMADSDADDQNTRRIVKKFRTLYKFGAKKRKKRGSKKCLSNRAASESPGRSLESTTSSISSFEAIASVSSLEATASLEAGPSIEREVIFTPNFDKKLIDYMDESFSAAKKRDLLQNTQGVGLNENESCAKYKIVDFDCLSDLISTKNITCSLCSTQGSLTFKESSKNRKGCAYKLDLYCNSCNTILNSGMTSNLKNKKPTNLPKGRQQAFDVNSRILSSSEAAGIGFSKLEQFFAGMNMPPPMHKKTYKEKQTQLHQALQSAANKSMKRAAQIIRNLYIEQDPSLKDQPAIDVMVSFDGTWHTRGHTSLIGVGVLIELQTGLVLDAAVLSKFCLACSKGPQKDSPEYQVWWDKHKINCQANTDVSSGGMEVEAAKLIWNRSIPLYNLRLTTMLSDGDCKAFNVISESQVYGENHPVTKQDCVNHVKKRMGTALRNLITERKAMKQSIGGAGGLTKKWVDKLQEYYGWAIKDHPTDVCEMYKAIWATLFHSLSTDEKPVHTKCPVGDESWCKYQKSIALNQPPPKHTNVLPEHIGELLLPIYHRLSKLELLQRCIGGKSQNANESFNARIWSRRSKSENASKQSIEIAVYEAILDYNEGPSAVYSAIEEMDMSVGKNTKLFAAKKLKQRIFQSENKLKKSWKMKRIESKREKSKKQGEEEKKEGKPYEAGAY